MKKGSKRKFLNKHSKYYQQLFHKYLAKEINIKIYNKIMNSIKFENRMDTIFMNSENSKTSDRRVKI